MHPAWMVVALLLSLLALRVGLAMRGRRQRGMPPRPGLLARHLRLARPAVVLLLAGFLGGPVSAWWLRGWTPFGSVHAWLGVLAAGLFATAGWLGLRLQHGRVSRARGANLHGLLGTLGMLVGAAAAAAGMVLLP